MRRLRRFRRLAARATITATVFDTNGSVLPAFRSRSTTTAGTLSDSITTTDANGAAKSTLTTSVGATVTASVGVGRRQRQPRHPRHRHHDAHHAVGVRSGIRQRHVAIAALRHSSSRRRQPADGRNTGDRSHSQSRQPPPMAAPSKPERRLGRRQLAGSWGRDRQRDPLAYVQGLGHYPVTGCHGRVRECREGVHLVVFVAVAPPLAVSVTTQTTRCCSQRQHNIHCDCDRARYSEFAQNFTHRVYGDGATDDTSSNSVVHTYTTAGNKNTSVTVTTNTQATATASKNCNYPVKSTGWFRAVERGGASPFSRRQDTAPSPPFQLTN